MPVGICGKLVTTLILAGLLPLLLTLAAGLLALRHTENLTATGPALWIILAAGSFAIVLCFIGGLWIARREIILPLLELRRGARKLEEGQLDFRLQTPGEKGSIFRHDEIGELAREFNRMAGELDRSVNALDQANRIKQQFIDLASHELRTPITYILGVTELAARRRYGAEEEALLARIRAKAQRLNHIVENMFKLMHGGLFEPTLVLGPVDLSQIVMSAAAQVEPFVHARHQTLQVKTSPALEPLTADGEKLRDILDNLLTNAIRFSPDGAELELELIDRDEAVELLVRDRGPGIAAEDLPYIFEPFYPGHAPLAYHTSGEYEYMTRGIGLGLSVVKRFVEMHGGAVKAEPANPGTRFRVYLPKHPVAAGMVTVP
jgi:signal transduction histidine kinase